MKFIFKIKSLLKKIKFKKIIVIATLLVIICFSGCSPLLALRENNGETSIYDIMTTSTPPSLIEIKIDVEVRGVSTYIANNIEKTYITVYSEQFHTVGAFNVPSSTLPRPLNEGDVVGATMEIKVYKGGKKEFSLKNLIL